jgi:phage minor structural protein
VGAKVSTSGYSHRNYQCIYFDSGSPIQFVPPPNSSWWKQIPDTTSGSPVLVTLPAGEDLYLVEDYNTYWYKMSTYYGIVGYVQKNKVTYDRHLTPEETQPRIITEQLFRLKEPIIDNDAMTVTVTGQHVSYDLNGNLIKDVSISQASPAMAIGRLIEGLMIQYRGTIATNLTSEENGTYTGEIKGKSGMYALLDPDKGIVKTFNARFTRDNWDLFVLERTGVDRGYRIRYGVNARGITWKKSSTNLVNRIVPVAKDEGGKDLYLPEEWVDPTPASTYPVTIMERLNVSGQVGKDKGTGDGTTWTEEDLLDEMRAKAEERFTVAHVDQIAEEVTIQIEPLEDTAEYAWLKGLKSVLLYDQVVAYDDRIGLQMPLYVDELEFDIIKKKILGLKLKNIQDFNGRTVTGYNVMNNSIGPEKLTDEVRDEIVQTVVDMLN